MIVIIIADNFKKGMKSQGCVGLLPYNKKNNLFQQQCESIKSVFPKANILYIYGFDSKRFILFTSTAKISHVDPIINNDYYKYNHGHSLSLIEPRLSKEEECMVLLGYDPLNNKHILPLKKRKVSTALIAKKTESKIGCIIDSQTQKINHIFFDLDNPMLNIYLLKKPELQLLCKSLNQENIKNMFLFEIINNIILNNGNIEALVV
jgi:hypothetical protein